jgi:hypothetical protein
MNYRPFLIAGAVVLLILAATTIDIRQVVWNPPWPARLAMGGVGVLLMLCAPLTGRAPPGDSGKPPT